MIERSNPVRQWIRGTSQDDADARVSGVVNAAVKSVTDHELWVAESLRPPRPSADGVVRLPGACKCVDCALVESVRRMTLPKYPQMRVIGDCVTDEQAREIILRTDPKLTNVDTWLGNDHAWARWWLRESHIERLVKLGRASFTKLHLMQEVLRLRLGVLPLEYCRTDWAASCWIGGPRGGCAPSGVLFYEETIGKWPGPDEVVIEWATIAASFPFIRARVTLMDHYVGDELDVALVASFSLDVADGAVRISKNHITERELREARHAHNANRAATNPGGLHERALPQEWAIGYAATIAPIADRIADEFAE